MAGPNNGGGDESHRYPRRSQNRHGDGDRADVNAFSGLRGLRLNTVAGLAIGRLRLGEWPWRRSPNLKSSLTILYSNPKPSFSPAGFFVDFGLDFGVEKC